MEAQAVLPTIFPCRRSSRLSPRRFPSAAQSATLSDGHARLRGRMFPSAPTAPPASRVGIPSPVVPPWPLALHHSFITSRAGCDLTRLFTTLSALCARCSTNGWKLNCYPF